MEKIDKIALSKFYYEKIEPDFARVKHFSGDTRRNENGKFVIVITLTDGTAKNWPVSSYEARTIIVSLLDAGSSCYLIDFFRKQTTK